MPDGPVNVSDKMISLPKKDNVLRNMEDLINNFVLITQGPDIPEGEAYFEVTKNSGQPFIVQTENFNVKVLGTSFCINTFGDNGKVYTALESGVVEMDCGRENTLILAPGQVAELDVRRPGACVRMSEVSVEQLVAWKKGLFCFRQTSLPDFLNLEDAEGEAYTGDISRNVSLEVLLGAISAQTTDIQFKIVNRTVYITKKRD